MATQNFSEEHESSIDSEDTIEYDSDESFLDDERECVIREDFKEWLSVNGPTLFKLECQRYLAKQNSQKAKPYTTPFKTPRKKLTK